MTFDARKTRLPCPVCLTGAMVYERKAHIVDGRLAAGHLMRCKRCDSRVVIVPAVDERPEPTEA